MAKVKVFSKDYLVNELDLPCGAIPLLIEL